MRMILCVTVVLFATGSVRAIDDEEEAQLVEVVDSLVIVAGELREIENQLLIKLEAQDLIPKSSLRTNAAIPIGNGFKDCRNHVTLIIYSFHAYLEGARTGPCRAISLSQELFKADLDKLKMWVSLSGSNLSNKLQAKVDSASVLLDDTWDYIEANIPDGCSAYDTTSE